MTLAKLSTQLKCAAHAMGCKPALPALWLISDTTRLPDPAPALRRLPPGSGFIFRHYEQPDREAMATHLLRLCRQRHILFLLAGDWRMALRLRADGVHYPEARAYQARAMHSAKPNAIVSAAAHSAAGVERAFRVGADMALLSPVFATQSHPGAAILGPVRFAKLVSAARLPIIALGGIHAGNARRLTGSGATGIAAISGLI